MNKLVLIFIFAIANLPLIGQTLPKPCYITKTDAPSLRGLRLGMTPQRSGIELGTKINLEEHKIEFTDLSIDEVKEYRYYSAPKISSTSFNGINSLRLSFFKDALYEIYVNYEKPEKPWKDAKELLDYLGDKYNLPSDSWFESRYMRCNGFSFSATLDKKGEVTIFLTDSGVNTIVNNKEEQLKSEYRRKIRSNAVEKEKVFKP